MGHVLIKKKDRYLKCNVVSGMMEKEEATTHCLLWFDRGRNVDKVVGAR